MAIDLSKTETRVLGALLEKQLTTPDVYPLTLNSLRLACNQTTNRDPVVSFDDQTVTQALHRLERRGFVRLASGAGSRAAKYRHRLADQLPMSSEEQAVMCVLMLRGQQTPGELKQRTERMHPFAELAEVEVTLEILIERELVRRCERRPGQKEDRYCELLSAEEEQPGEAGPLPVPGASAEEGLSAAAQLDDHRAGIAAKDSQSPLARSGGLAALERRVERLELELTELRDAVAVAAGSS